MCRPSSWTALALNRPSSGWPLRCRRSGRRLPSSRRAWRERARGPDVASPLRESTGRSGRSSCGSASAERAPRLEPHQEGRSSRVTMLDPDHASWCGRAYGRLVRSRLQDPRLDLACTTLSGGPLAFAWFEPGRHTAYVAVRQPGYVEVYPVAGRAPIRITTTTGISVAGSSATFEISEHDRGGALLRSSTLEARIAG